MNATSQIASEAIFYLPAMEWHLKGLAAKSVVEKSNLCALINTDGNGENARRPRRTSYIVANFLNVSI